MKGENRMTKLSFLGLGVMGRPMAMNLAKSGGADLIVYDVDEKKLEPFRQAGIRTAGTVTETAGADFIFLCLPNTHVVEEMLLGPDGIGPGLREGQIIVDFSTIDHKAACKIAKTLSKKGVGYLDAPVSGRDNRAAQAKLTIMCGGDRAVFEKAKPWIDTMGNNVKLLGKAGSGQIAKMINGCIFKANIAIFSELLPLAVKLGLDPVEIGDVINTSTGQSDASSFLIPRTLDRNFDYVPMIGGYKDLVQVTELCTELHVPLPTLAGAIQTYQLALLRGYGDLYMNGMIRPYEDLLGVEFKRNDEPAKRSV